MQGVDAEDFAAATEGWRHFPLRLNSMKLISASNDQLIKSRCFNLPVTLHVIRVFWLRHVDEMARTSEEMFRQINHFTFAIECRCVRACASVCA